MNFILSIAILFSIPAMVALIYYLSATFLLLYIVFDKLKEGICKAIKRNI